ncbi:MAG: methyltransferase domain-containing protein [Deltaproteobacteria bacterium]|nr:methyltransferase domain-containing protein [Deltaproteobacteria bacterium]
MDEHDRWREETRQSWNVATLAHNRHKLDQARWLASGGSPLFPEELELLGDVAGRRLLHLLCNAGQDSLALARLGAKVTGVDLSDEAILAAQNLSTESGIGAEFVRSEAFQYLEHEERRFEVVFSSYGALTWLPDLDRWAQGAARVLEPGGRVVICEFHPLVWSIDAEWRLSKDPYFAPGHRFSAPVEDYVGRSGPALAPMGYRELDAPFHNPHPAHAYQWTLADTVTAVARAGLFIERLTEYPYANGCRVIPSLVEGEGRRLHPPPGVPSVPLMYGLVARR